MNNYNSEENSQSNEYPAERVGGSDTMEPVLGGMDAEISDSRRDQAENELRNMPGLMYSATPGSPDEYELNYGEDVQVSSHIDSRFRSFAHENGISGDMAQKLVDFNNQLEASRNQEYEQQKQGWAKETRSLPGWQGSAYKQNLSIANKAMQSFASPVVAKLIQDSGYSCHPEVVKTFYNIGLRMAEDSYVDGRSSNLQQKTAGEILYPNHPV